MGRDVFLGTLLAFVLWPAQASDQGNPLADRVAISQYMERTSGLSDRDYTVEARPAKDGLRVYRVTIAPASGRSLGAGMAFDVNIDQKDGRVVSESPAR